MAASGEDHYKASQEVSGQHAESKELSGDITTAPQEISGQHVESQKLSGDIDTAPQEISGQHEESQELSGDITTAPQEISGQHEESQELSGDIDTAPQEISGQHADSQELSEDIDTAPREISGQHAESQELSGDIDTAPREISGQHEESEELSGDIDTAPREISGQHEESQELSGDIDTAPQEISGQYEESQELSGDIDTAPREISGQHVESQELSGDIDTAPQEISGQYEESQELSGDITTAPREISGQHVESQELSGDIDTAPQEISGQHEESQELSGDIDTAPRESVEQNGTQGDSQENLDTHLTAHETASTNMRLTPSEGSSQTYEDRPHFMLNTVEAWRRENIYVTKVVEAVKEKISSKGCVCVIGVPGAGKSTALHHAALFLEYDGFIIYSVYGPDEFLKYYDINKKQVFVLDDALGVYSVDQGKVRLWQEHNENVRLTLSTNTKLLVSIRTQIFMYETIRDKNIVFLDKSVTTDHVDFSDAVYKLGIDDMRGMLTHYMTTHGVNVDNINKVIKQVWGYTDKELTDMTEEDRQLVMSCYTAGVEFSQCFPLLCGVYINTHFKQNPWTFFTNPFPALTKVFQNIKSDNKHQFCALVLCTVFDGKLNTDMFSPICEFNKELYKNDVEIRNVIMTSCDLEGQKCLPQIKSALNSLDGVYVTRVENTYKMTHAVFHDVVTYLFNGGDPSFVFKYGTRQLIRDRIRLSNTQDVNDPYMIIINDDTNIERLADRLFRDWMSDRETEDEDTRQRGAKFITDNPNIDDDRLISCLRSKLSDRAQTDKTLINDLFIRCMLTVYNNWYTYKHGDVTQYKLIQTCLQVADVDCNQFIGIVDYPLYISVWTGSLQLTQLLLHHGADKRTVYWRGDPSVLHWLCMYTKYNKVELVKLLVQGDLSVVDVEGCTIHDNILTHVDYWGRNILHYSVDDYDLTKHLLTYPSLQKDIHKCDKDNRTPCWYIINNKKPNRWGGTKNIVIKKKQDMIQLYKKHGAVL